MLDDIITTGDKLENFPISQRWPAADPETLQLYSMPTPNGQKASIMLEEIGLPYEAHKIPLNDQGVTSPEFLSLNPNNKIPAIIDPDGPDGKALGLFESGAILSYLAEKSGKFQGKTQSERWEVQQWLMFQMGGLGPMSGQFGFFHSFAGKDFDDKRPHDRFLNEVKRLLDVLESRLADRDWVAGDYSIADIAIGPWLWCIEDFYKAGKITGLRARRNVSDYMERFIARPAVKKGWNVPVHSW